MAGGDLIPSSHRKQQTQLKTRNCRKQRFGCHLRGRVAEKTSMFLRRASLLSIWRCACERARCPQRSCCWTNGISMRCFQMEPSGSDTAPGCDAGRGLTYPGPQAAKCCPMVGKERPHGGKKLLSRGWKLGNGAGEARTGSKLDGNRPARRWNRSSGPTTDSGCVGGALRHVRQSFGCKIHRWLQSTTRVRPAPASVT
jgi:hypothetical protein